MKKNRKKRREVRAGRKRKSSTLGKAAAPKRSSKQKTKSTTLNSKRRVQLSSSGKSHLKAPKSGHSLPKRAPSLTQKRNSSPVEYLAGHWESIPRPEKIRRLQSLIGDGWKIRALARVLKVVSEGRIRQLLKSGEPPEAANGTSDNTATAPHAHGIGEGNSRAKHRTASISVKPKPETDGPHALPRAQDLGVAESAHQVNQLPSPPTFPASSGRQPVAVSKVQDRGITVQPFAARKGRGRPEAEEIKHSSPEAATREESRAEDGVAKSTAPDYAIEDPRVGGQLVADWIRSNFKRPDWSNVIADYTTAYWFNWPSFRKEMQRANNVPAGLRPLDVIRYCLSDAIKAELEGGFFQDASRKWFVRWASILLPDPAIRRKAVEMAGQILGRPTTRWSYMAYDPHLRQPTPCIRSQGTPLADFLEELTKYVDFRSLLKNSGPLEAEVKEALQYAAATLREGSPPPLD